MDASLLSSGVASVLAKLKFISKIQEGEKVNVRNLYVQQPGWFTGFSRTYYGESREDTFKFLKSVFDQAFEMVFAHPNSIHNFNTNIKESLISELRRVDQGIESLEKTYIDDRMFTSKLQTLRELIKARLNDIQNIDVPPLVDSDDEQTSL